MERVADDPATSSAKSARAPGAAMTAPSRRDDGAVQSCRRDDGAVQSSRRDDGVVGLQVREVLEAPCLAGARVLAGAQGLDRIVQRLNVMEVPDILPWVKPHELLLTTGYPVRDDPDALVDLVGELDDRGLAALAIKLHRYIDELPPEVLAEADRRSFPVIEFPAEVGFNDVPKDRKS